MEEKKMTLIEEILQAIDQKNTKESNPIPFS